MTLTMGLVLVTGLALFAAVMTVCLIMGVRVVDHLRGLEDDGA